MPITIKIENGTGSKTVTLNGQNFEGDINMSAEAKAALDAADAAGLGGDKSTYTAGGVTLSYAQVVGIMRLGTEKFRVSGVDEYFRPSGTTVDSISNNILRDPRKFDNRPRSDGAPVATVTIPIPPNTAVNAASFFTGANALPAGATVTGVAVTDANGRVVYRGNDGNIPASALATPGNYSVRVFYKVGNGPELYRDSKITVANQTAPEVSRPAGESMSLDEAALRTMAALPADARILGAQFDNNPEMAAPGPYNIPASQMTPGKHSLKVRYRGPSDATDQFKIVPINLNAPAEVKPGENGSAYGAVLNMPAEAKRQPDDMVNGQPVKRPIVVGNMSTTQDFPEGAKYIIFVDGNPQGSARDLPKDRNTILDVPGSIADGPHQIQVRVLRPNQPSIIYPTVAVSVGPAKPLTQFNGDPKMEKSSYSRWSSDVAKVVVDVTENLSGVKISVNGRNMTTEEFSGGLSKGSNTVVLRNPDIKMKNNVNYATAGTYDVVITLPGGETKKTQLVITSSSNNNPNPNPIPINPKPNPGPGNVVP